VVTAAWLRFHDLPATPDGYAIALNGYDPSDPQPEIERVRRSWPGLEVIQIDG
jgi:hypothetical protein